MTRDTSSAGTLTLEATPADTGAIEFALPLSELDTDFPAAAEPCGAEQLAWLDARATPLERRLRIDMRNNASEGAMLALVDFRADVDTATGASSTHVLVTCPTDAPTTSARAAGLAVDIEGTTARFRGLRGAQTSLAVPDIPVTWNLAPGETGVIDIEVTAERGTSGSLVVTMLNGRDESLIRIPGSDFVLPGVWRHGDSYFRIGATGFECVRDAHSEVVACDDEDWAELERLRDSNYATG